MADPTLCMLGDRIAAQLSHNPYLQADTGIQDTGPVNIRFINEEHYYEIQHYISIAVFLTMKNGHLLK